MSNEDDSDVIVVGGGGSGLAAAIEAKKPSLLSINAEKLQHIALV